MPTCATRDAMDDRLAQTVVPLMENQAYRAGVRAVYRAVIGRIVQEEAGRQELCGRLVFPSPAELGLATPAGLDWSLDGVAPADAKRWRAPDRLERAS